LQFIDRWTASITRRIILRLMVVEVQK